MKAPYESHLQDWIWDNRLNLFEGKDTEAFENIEVFAREYWLPLGTADLMAINHMPTDKLPLSSVLAIEIKKDVLNLGALAQTLKYVRECQNIWRFAISGQADLRELGDSFSCFPRVSGMMIGHSVEENILIAAHAADIQVILYDLTETGYTFKRVKPYGEAVIQYLGQYHSLLGKHIRDLHNERVKQIASDFLAKRQESDIPLSASIDEHWRYYASGEEKRI